MGFDYLCTVNPSGLWIETKKQAAAFAVVTVFAVWFYRELFGSLFFLLRVNLLYEQYKKHSPCRNAHNK